MDQIEPIAETREQAEERVRAFLSRPDLGEIFLQCMREGVRQAKAENAELEKRQKTQAA